MSIYVSMSPVSSYNHWNLEYHAIGNHPIFVHFNSLVSDTWELG
jgi:hypothetical protein